MKEILFKCLLSAMWVYEPASKDYTPIFPNEDGKYFYSTKDRVKSNDLHSPEKKDLIDPQIFYAK